MPLKDKRLSSTCVLGSDDVLINIIVYSIDHFDREEINLIEEWCLGTSNWKKLINSVFALPVKSRISVELYLLFVFVIICYRIQQQIRLPGFSKLVLTAFYRIRSTRGLFRISNFYH